MSTTAGMPQIPERNYKKSFHQRHDSGELDVFEAARYFSGANEVSGANFSHQKMMRGGRISLDIPVMTSSTRSPPQILRDRLIMAEKATKEKKYKQPISPGGRLASFLNSLFSSQISSKKKKSKSSSIKDEDRESPVGRRKRRSSISHFPTTTVNLSNNIIHSSSNSGFRTPPPYANTPTKNSLKDFRNSLDHKPVTHVTTLSKNNGHVKSSDSIKKSSKDSNGWLDEKFKFSTSAATKGFSSSEKYNGWLDEKFKFSTSVATKGFSLTEKYKSNFGNGISGQIPSEDREFRNFINEMDDGAASDSSSDLFELPNYDLGCCYSSGLPVYESTHMDTIKRGAPIASGAK